MMDINADLLQWFTIFLIRSQLVMLKNVKCKLDKRICFLLCAIDIFSKYAWVFL